MNSKIRKISLITATCAFAFCLSAGTAMLASAEEESYYVCFSNQNYSVRNSNKMEYSESEYVLTNVTLSSVIDFYVTDNSGMRWYDSDNSPLKVEEAGLMRYDILFSPGTTYENGSHVSYRFYEPDSYSVTVDGEEIELSYNPYNTAYDLYYLSSVYIEADSVVELDGETHRVAESGYYRILLTPEKTVNGNTYLFDKNGNYGSGDDFKYSIYIDDAPQYFAVFENIEADGYDTEIDGKDAVSLTRYEDNVSAAEYRSAEVFAPDKDFGIKYCVYEQNPDGSFRLIDDDNNEDTAISKITADDKGWYTLSFIETEAGYISTFKDEEKNFGGWYLAGEFNGYCYDEDGNIDLTDEYKFAEIEEDGDDYEEDYTQYIAYLTVSEKQLKNGNLEFYITDGKTKFKDGAGYIEISIAGTYKIICSDEHTYGRGRNFRYVLEDEGKDGEELLISTADEFLSFAEKCSLSADYSVGLKVYLTADIDFREVTFTPVRVFSGTFSGGYHSIKNITYEGKGGKASVFETLTYSGTIERLDFENITLGDKNCDNVGVIGTNYGTVNGVTVSGRITGATYVGGVVAVNGVSNTDTGNSSDRVNRATIKNCKNYADIYGESYAGGICGSNTGEIFSCESCGKVTGIKTRSQSTVSDLGGIAGYSLGKIYDCNNTGKVEGSSSSRRVGGIAGLCVGEIYFSVNRGVISADRYAGGTVGYYGLRQSENTDGILGGNQNREQDPIGNYNILNYLVNYGEVTANSYAGGIVGNVAGLGGGTVSPRVLKIYNCASSGDVEADAGSYAGGIAGNAAGVKISSCISTGTIQSKGLNGGNYVGGIAGYGGDIAYSMSSATLKGAEYVGGIAGYASSAVIGCYTNAVLLLSEDTVYSGGIAGYSANYNPSENEFTSVAGNYYIGAFGGIAGIDYQSVYDDAAASVQCETLLSAGALSPELREEFSREYWQGGKGFRSYPLLINFETVEECSEFDDDGLFKTLFGKNADMLFALSKDACAITYTVTFMEWNKDNGDLYDDGELQTDNFEIISSIRVTDGQSADAPELKFAAINENGKYVYDGGDARYFVSFPDVVNVNGNLTVYAEYREMVTSLTDSENLVFAEGEFVKGSEITLVKIGDFYTVKITLDGEEVQVKNITLKYLVGDNAEKFTVKGSNGNTLSSTVSGKYISFKFTSGDYFSVEKYQSDIPFWAWLLIGIGVSVAVAGIAYLTVFLIRRKKR